MEDRDEAEEGGRLPLFYTIGDKHIEYLSFTEAKTIERVHCPICLDAHRAGLLNWQKEIVLYHYNKKKRRDAWWVKWQNYPASKNTCEPIDNLQMGQWTRSAAFASVNGKYSICLSPIV
ncbi:hypothetical protein T492DRAFT_883590 [Pavlovales sp. CCMP2436]|nr:hypothetical protein T492DRAFT_883590 [Pavlovales sp. CCMP2436]